MDGTTPLVPVPTGGHVTAIFFSMVFTWAGSAAFFGVFLVIAVCSVVGNFLVIAAYMNDKSLRRKPTNMFLVSLAVTDLFTGLVAIPSYTATRAIVSDFTCFGNTRFLLFFPGMICGLSSITHLSLIAIDRYIAISRPLRYRMVVTRRRCTISILIGALFSIITCSWPAFSMQQGISFCGDQKETKVVRMFVIVLCIIILLYFGVMIFCHVCMIRNALHHVRVRRTLSNCAKSKMAAERDAKSRLRATVTVAIIMGAFVICWAPIIFKFLFQSFFQYSSKTFLIVQVMCEIPFYANSMINPIIYGYRNEHFRVGYKRTLNKCCPCLVDRSPERKQSLRELSSL